LNADRRQLTSEQRREIVASLREAGHSLRAIGGAVGVDDKTVRNDLSTADLSAVPDRVKGLDGKSRPARRPTIVAAKNEREAERAQRASSMKITQVYWPFTRSGVCNCVPVRSCQQRAEPSSEPRPALPVILEGVATSLRWVFEELPRAAQMVGTPTICAIAPDISPLRDRALALSLADQLADPALTATDDLRRGEG